MLWFLLRGTVFGREISVNVSEDFWMRGTEAGARQGVWDVSGEGVRGGRSKEVNNRCPASWSSDGVGVPFRRGLGVTVFGGGKFTLAACIAASTTARLFITRVRYVRAVNSSILTGGPYSCTSDSTIAFVLWWYISWGSFTTRLILASSIE